MLCTYICFTLLKTSSLDEYKHKFGASGADKYIFKALALGQVTRQNSLALP